MFIRQAGASLASLFVIGRLDLGAVVDSEEHDLSLAAAATFEFFLQEVILPNAAVCEILAVSDETRRTCTEISFILKPHNGPAIFSAPQLTHNASSIQLRFPTGVRVTIPPQRVKLLAEFISNCRDVESTNIEGVVEFIETEFLARLRCSEYFIDD